MDVYYEGVLFRVGEGGELRKMQNFSDNAVDVIVTDEFCKKYNINTLGPEFVKGEFDVVSFPKSITYVCRFAFADAHVKEIIWPTGCKTIPMFCFDRCSAHTLKNIEQVDEIHNSAFVGSHFISIDWPQKCNIIPTCCFQNSGISLVKGLDNVDIIHDFAFARTTFDEFCWPPRCEVIPQGCFEGSLIKTVHNLNNVHEVRKMAFYGAPNLEMLDFSNSIVSFDEFALSGIPRDKVILPYYINNVNKIFN